MLLEPFRQPLQSAYVIRGPVNRTRKDHVPGNTPLVAGGNGVFRLERLPRRVPSGFVASRILLWSAKSQARRTASAAQETDLD